jgi:hypothetical protein
MSLAITNPPGEDLDTQGVPAGEPICTALPPARASHRDVVSENRDVFHQKITSLVFLFNEANRDS